MPETSEADTPSDKDKPPAANMKNDQPNLTAEKSNSTNMPPAGPVEARRDQGNVAESELAANHPPRQPQNGSSSEDEEDAYDSAVEEYPVESSKSATSSKFQVQTQDGNANDVWQSSDADKPRVKSNDKDGPIPSSVERKQLPSNRSSQTEAKHGVEQSRTESTTQGTVPSQEDGHVRQQSGSGRIPVPERLDATGPLHGASEWSHQQVVPREAGDGDSKKTEVEWQDMPAYAPFDLYNDDGKLVAREAVESDDEGAYAGLGGAGKGYTRVNVDEDAQSATSMDDNTKYLFKEPAGTNLDDEHEEARNPLAQLEATKDLLTEPQRIAYVGVTRVAMSQLVNEMEAMEGTKGSKKDINTATESIKMWSQKMILRLYTHMDISSAEQIMIEQLAEHGVQPDDLTPTLMQNSRVTNPMADQEASEASPVRPSMQSESVPDKAPSPTITSPEGESNRGSPAPPPYKEHQGDDMPDVRTPSQLPTTKKIDIDLRWTVLCDLFLVLIADSIYDARSRVLLERVGSFLDVPWLEICRFEKRVTDALEMQEAADKETWNEDEHLETRRKMAVKKRMVMMGLATVGGSLVIGLSAGLLAPVIGAGLAAGFTTIGVAGTSGFLAGAGGAAMITTIGVTTGGAIAVKSTSRRMGSVKTFEYRPLHNNKRVNLIVTVSGWMIGKVDDVRLPYSPVSPIMGDVYSLLWEPEMLQSMGQTINILATEALTQGLQQVLGSTVLIALMAALQLPIVLTKLAYLIDNPWSVSLDRATSAGQVLADSLIDRNLGVRPVTLVGFSLGARVIHSCLKELASRGAVGLVQNVYLFGSPIVAKKDEYLRARAIIAGRFVNGYAKNDWILGYLFRATGGGIMQVAGLAPIEGIPGLENIDVAEWVDGHMSYRAAMPRLLREVGWMVESDDFVEIEDPDPDNHQVRQREIIAEIDEARKELEQKPKKRTFGFFSRGKAKLKEKKEWETYDEGRAAPEEDSGQGADRRDSNVLFDIEAIRNELASEHIQVKQLESTLPPMKLDLDAANALPGNSSQSPYSTLRSTKSYDAGTLTQAKADATSSLPSLPNGPENGVMHQEDREPAFTSGEGHETEENRTGVTMTFDHTPELHDNSHSTAASSIVTPLQTKSNIGATSTPRPGLKSTVSSPISINDLGHNAWADDADEFGKEEVTMSFE